MLGDALFPQSCFSADVPDPRDLCRILGVSRSSLGGRVLRRERPPQAGWDLPLFRPGGSWLWLSTSGAPERTLVSGARLAQKCLQRTQEEGEEEMLSPGPLGPPKMP